MADSFIALYDFHGVFVHRVVKLSFSYKYFSDQWLPCTLINMISTHSWYDGGLLRDSAQAFSNVFFSSQSKRAFLSNLLMSLQLRNIRFRQVYWLISEQTTNFFQWQECFLDFLFFREIMGVRLIHKCSLYTSLYGIYAHGESNKTLTVHYLKKW